MRLDWANCRTEQKQHVNLSDHAHGVVEADIAAFMPDATPSGFINHVINSFWDLSDASITMACDRKRDELILAAKKALYKESMPDDPNLTKFDASTCHLGDSHLHLVEMLVNEHRDQLIRRMTSYAKGPALKIRLQNKLFDMLYRGPDDEFPELANYGGNQGKYIKALIEDYTDMPYVERERIVFRKSYDALKGELELAPSERRMLRIKLYPNDDGKVLTFDMKPYDLMTDIGANFNYIVGLSRPAENGGAEFIPASIRLSRIDDIMPRSRSYASGKVSAAQKKALLEAIHERGVPYLVGKTYDQKILLTPDGVKQYNRILHMRPSFDPKTVEKLADGSQILSFHCSGTQIKNYFLKFGKDAIVLEPASLAEEFREHHFEAARSYD